MGEIQLELTQFFTFVLCPLSFRHIDGCGDNLGQRAPGGKHMIAGSFDPFDCSIRQEESELGHEISFLVHGLLNRSPHSIAVLWVNALPHALLTWKALQ